MTDSDERERALLHEMRRFLSPTPADRERIEPLLLSSIARGVTVPYDVETLSQGSATATGFSAGLRGLGPQLVAAAAIASAGFGTGYLTGRAASGDPTVERTVGARTEPREIPPPVPIQAPNIPAEPPAVAASSLAVEKAPGSPPGPSSSALSAQTLSEEARELQRVDRALRNGMPTLALGILRELDERIPRGALLEERAAARLVARCQNGDAEAPRAARIWLQRNPRSVYVTRLEAACTEKSDARMTEPAGRGNQ